MTGSGTQGDPYIISDVTDLQAMENNLNSYYELGNDIDASVTSGWNAGAGFDPVTVFRGNFDGKGFTISDLFINRGASDTIGLFGYAFTALEIKDVTLSNPTITGKDNVGSLAGQFDNGGTISGITITNCTIVGAAVIGGMIGIVWDAAISDCSSSGTITVTKGSVGGLAGQHGKGSIANCNSSCTIDATGVTAVAFSFGGLFGIVSVSVTECYATGSVTGNSNTDFVGGFSGYINSTFSTVTVARCYSTGNVSGDSEVGGFSGRCRWSNNDIFVNDCYARGDANGDSYVGGFFGQLSAATSDNCFSTGAATGNTFVGGFCGDNDGSTITDCFWDTEASGNATSSGGTGKTTTQMKTKATFTDASWTFSASVWGMASSLNDGYPNLAGISIARRDIGVRGTNLVWFDEDDIERKARGTLVTGDSDILKYLYM